MKLPFNIDLSGKTAVVTGGGGVLGSMFAKALAKTASEELNREIEHFSVSIEDVPQN